MSKSNIVTTRNYRLFKYDLENRQLQLKKHKRLKESMKQYGFLRCFPIACYRNGKRDLVVKDGQHRLAFAEELGLPVHYIVEDVDFDIATVNGTPIKWTPKDYADKHAANGKSDYAEGIEFCNRHRIPIGTGFSLLAGTTNFSNIEQAFREGRFKVKDREWADKVASTYSAVVAMSSEVRNARFIEACMAVCRLGEFDQDRLLHSAKRCRDKLISYSTRDAYLDMMEEVYNFGRKNLVPIKMPAIQAMRERNVGAANGSRKVE